MRKLSVVLLLLPFLSLLAARPARAIDVEFEADPSVPLVYVNLAVKAGSVMDPKGQSGVSNFMGEMLLRGTRNRTKEQLDLELDQMGARLEVETRAEALVVRGAVLKSQLEPFLALVTDIVTRPSFPDREIRKLKDEITSGILEELGRDQSLAGRRFNQFLFQGHPYGNPVLGTTKDVEGLTRSQIAAQYDKLMRANMLLVVGTGDAPKERIASWAQAIAAARPGGQAAPLVAKPEDAPKRRVLLVDKPDRTQTQIQVGQIGVRMTDPDFFPLYVANHAFGGGSFSARMMVEIRVKRGWSYGAYSFFRHGRQPRLWQYSLFPAAKDTPDALALSLKMVDDLRAKGVTAEEFEFAQRSLVNSAGFMFNTPQKRVENKLLERTLDLPDGFMKTFGPAIRQVTLAQANAALPRFLRPDRLSVVVLGTASELRDKVAKAAGVAPKDVQVSPYTQE